MTDENVKAIAEDVYDSIVVDAGGDPALIRRIVSVVVEVSDQRTPDVDGLGTPGASAGM